MGWAMPARRSSGSRAQLACNAASVRPFVLTRVRVHELIMGAAKQTGACRHCSVAGTMQRPRMRSHARRLPLRVAGWCNAQPRLCEVLPLWPPLYVLRP